MQTDSHTYRKADRQTGIPYIHTYIQKDWQTHADRQTEAY